MPLPLEIESKSSTQERPRLATAQAPPVPHDCRQFVREQLERIMASEAFRGSKRSREFLSYVAEKTLNAESDLLKERLIGVHLYGKTGAYDTSADSTVRVRANEVRRRLLQYAEQFGRDEPFRILLPAGSYVLELCPVAKRSTRKETPSAKERKPAVPPLRGSWLIAPTIVALLVCILAFQWMLSPDSLFKEFWRPLVVANRSVVLEVQGAPDSGMIPLRSVRQLLRIHDISRAFGGGVEVVTVGDTPVVSAGGSAQILLGRTLGSSVSFPATPRYRIEARGSGSAIFDATTGVLYGTDGPEGGRQTSYALVSRVLPAGENAGTLTLNGTDDIAVEAAEDLVTNPEELGYALRNAGTAAVEKDLQILLAVQHSGHDVWKRAVLAVRSYP